MLLLVPSSGDYARQSTGADAYFATGNAHSIAAFQDPTVFKRRLSGLLDYTRAQEPADGQPVYSPGDIARDFERERASGGIPLSGWEREQFERIAAEECLPLQTLQPTAKA